MRNFVLPLLLLLAACHSINSKLDCHFKVQNGTANSDFGLEQDLE